MDKILLANMHFNGHIGVSQEERDLGQQLRVDVEVELNTRGAGISDQLSDTVDYDEMYTVMKQVTELSRVNLVETLTESIASKLLQAFPIHGIKVRVAKLHPPLTDGKIDSVAVEIHRTNL